MVSNLKKWNAEGTPQTDAGVEPAAGISPERNLKVLEPKWNFSVFCPVFRVFNRAQTPANPQGAFEIWTNMLNCPVIYLDRQVSSL